MPKPVMYSNCDITHLVYVAQWRDGKRRLKLWLIWMAEPRDQSGWYLAGPGVSRLPTDREGLLKLWARNEAGALHLAQRVADSLKLSRDPTRLSRA